MFFNFFTPNILPPPESTSLPTYYMQYLTKPLDNYFTTKFLSLIKIPLYRPFGKEVSEKIRINRCLTELDEYLDALFASSFLHCTGSLLTKQKNRPLVSFIL